MATADALPGRDPRDRGLRQLRISLSLALGIVGFVIAAQWNSQATRTEYTSSAQQVLARQVFELEADQQALRAEIAQHEDTIAEFQQSGGISQSALKDLNDRLASSRLAAGLTEVRGPGVVVALSNSSLIVPEGANPDDYIVQADDLRDIVIALWGSGAEAISINGQRLVSTSSIYGVGPVIVVNGVFLSPPFQIAAIGPGELRAAFDAHPAFLGRAARRIDAYGLEYRAASVDDVRVAAFVGTTRFRWATPASEAAE